MSRPALIVDDNKNLAFFTARNLEREIEGLRVLKAASCAEAWEAVSQTTPSVIIADLKLSDGNGLELIARMKERFPGLSAILISGESPPASAETSGLAGALLKPYDAQDLVDLVNRALAGTDVPPSVATSPEVVECEGYDRHHLQNRLSALLSGLRAFGADLRAYSGDANEVERTVDEYLDRLCGVVKEVSEELPSCPKGRKGQAKESADK